MTCITSARAPIPPAYPGQAWVQVFAHGANDANAICGALRQGLLYSSNGPSLARIRVTDTSYEVWPKTAKTVVAFIGQDGHELMRTGSLDAGRVASYSLRNVDPERYVRARITAPNGTKAWTPAVFTESRPSAVAFAAPGSISP